MTVCAYKQNQQWKRPARGSKHQDSECRDFNSQLFYLLLVYCAQDKGTYGTTAKINEIMQSQDGTKKCGGLQN